MYRSKYRISSQSGLIALALIAAGTLGLLEACSSDGGNPAPSTPVIITGGSAGSAGKGGADENSGGNSTQGGSSQGGNSNAHAGTGAIDGDAGEGGEGGAAGAESGGRGGAPAACPTSDVGFFNQPSKSQSSPFDNVKRLGTHDALPPLP
jgi:hypothetical protein